MIFLFLFYFLFYVIFVFAVDSNYLYISSYCLFLLKCLIRWPISYEFWCPLSFYWSSMFHILISLSLFILYFLLLFSSNLNYFLIINLFFFFSILYSWQCTNNSISRIVAIKTQTITTITKCECRNIISAKHKLMIVLLYNHSLGYNLFYNVIRY